MTFVYNNRWYLVNLSAEIVDCHIEWKLLNRKNIFCFVIRLLANNRNNRPLMRRTQNSEIFLLFASLLIWFTILGTKLIPQRSSSSGEEEAVGADARKMRLVAMLRQAYGNDIERVPGFIEFAESAKAESRRTFVDAAAQTSYDLLETWFPALTKRIAESEKIQNSDADEDMPSVVKSKQKPNQSKFAQNQYQRHFGINWILLHFCLNFIQF